MDLHLDAGTVVLHAASKQAELSAHVLTLVATGRGRKKVSENSHMPLLELAG